MNEAAQLNQQLKNAEDLIKRRDDALKLGEIPLFRQIILEDFMVTEAARLVGESADPALDPQQRADALGMAQAAGHLKRYLSVMVRMGNTAEQEKIQIEEALDELRQNTDQDVGVEDADGRGEA